MILFIFSEKAHNICIKKCLTAKSKQCARGYFNQFEATYPQARAYYFSKNSLT